MLKFTCLPAVLLLVACGGTGVPVDVQTTPRENFSAMQPRHDALVSEVLNFSRTRKAAYPTTGTGRFNGSSEVFVSSGPNGPRYKMIGTAQITAEFGPQKVTGRLDNFVVRERGTDGGYTFYETDGAIRIGERSSRLGDGGADGVILGHFGADYRGTVETSDGQIKFDGAITGQFRGNRPNPPEGETIVRGVFAETVSSRGATIDGNNAYTEISLVATAPL